MKTTTLFISLMLCFFYHAYAQGLLVTYEETMNVRLERPDLGNIDNPQIRAAIENSMRERIELMNAPRVSQLVVSNGISLYTIGEFDPLTNSQTTKQIGENTTFNSNTTVVNTRNTIFKDHYDKLLFTLVHFDEKEYLTEEPLEELNWKIGKRKREVSGYQCLEATAKRANGSVVVAWYTPDIPVSEGPAEFNGLPGLILYVDVDNGKTIYACTSVERIEDLAEIQIPENVEKISKEQYQTMVSSQIERIEEMMERRRATNGSNTNRIGGTVIIR